MTPYVFFKYFLSVIRQIIILIFNGNVITLCSILFFNLIVNYQYRNVEKIKIYITLRRIVRIK